MSLQGKEGRNGFPTCLTTPARESSQSTNSKLPAVCCLPSPSHRLWGSVPVRQRCRGQTSSQKNLPFGPQVVAASPIAPSTAGKPAARTPGAGQGLQGWAVPAFSFMPHLCSESPHPASLRLSRPLLSSACPVVQSCSLTPSSHSITPQVPSGTPHPGTSLLQSA